MADGPSMDSTQPVVLTIAGSDSSGGAGLQADLRTLTSLNCLGTTAVTCVTAQTPEAVNDVEEIAADMVSAQIRAARDSYPLAAAKTGMLYSAPIITAVAKAITDCGIRPLVIDPVMVASCGPRLLSPEAVDTLCAELLPLATVVTPNIPEAEVLWGHDISSLSDVQTAAGEIASRYAAACVIKGGHMAHSPESTDVLAYEDGTIKAFTKPRIDCGGIHGTGCMFSASLSAFLARGDSVGQAVEHAKEFVTAAIQRALTVGQHTVLNPSCI